MHFIGHILDYIKTNNFVKSKILFTPLLEASVDSKIEHENFVMIECSESFVKMFYMNKRKNM